MSIEDQIKAAAELDGIIKCENPEYQSDVLYHKKSQGFLLATDIPNYHESYDAIIPLIQKQSKRVQLATWIKLNAPTGGEFEVTPAQLLEALLRATGKRITPPATPPQEP